MFTLDNFYADDPKFMESIKAMLDDYVRYVPIVLKGETGIGKTHLLKAFEQYLKEKHGLKNSVYITAEKFTNDFVKALQTKKLENFRSQFLEIDALFFDDFDFLQYKKGSQEELYFIITECLNRQAFVCVAVTTPCDLKVISSQKLSSVLLNGVNTDIPVPGYEAKRLKLTEVFSQFNCFINGDIIDYLVGLKLSLNELIGISKKIIVMKELEGKGCVNINPEEIKSLVE